MPEPPFRAADRAEQATGSKQGSAGLTTDWTWAVRHPLSQIGGILSAYQAHSLIRTSDRRSPRMQSTYPLPDLIARRCEELGLTRMQLLKRMGYANVTKGLRRLTAIEQGNLRRADQFHEPLAAALEIPSEVVEDAFAATRAALDAEAEAAYREAFQPHGVILTALSVPSPIHVAALLGGVRLLHIPLDTDAPPDTFSQQARQRLPPDGGVPGFGWIVGYVVNYSPDEAVQFDLEGHEVARFGRAIRLGQTTVRIGGRTVPLRSLMGPRD